MPDKTNIIIKKRGRKHPHTRHAGAWKIAYADFVTAMMTFFLLMWLINTVSEAQRKGIADYFARSFINLEVRNGAQGMLGGVIADGDKSHGAESLGGATPNIDNDEVFGATPDQGEQTSTEIHSEHDTPNKANQGRANNGETQEKKDDKGRNESLSALVLEDQVRGLLTKDKTKKDMLIQDEVNRIMLHIPEESDEQHLGKAAAIQPGEKAENNQSPPHSKQAEKKEKKEETQAESPKPSKPKAVNYLEKFENTFMTAKQKGEQTALKDMSNAFVKAIKGSKDLAGLTSQIVFELRPEGLRLQLLDSDKNTMFPSGSAQALPKTEKLLHALVELLRAIQNRLVVSGHTDAYPYTNIRHYSNWELSADRANTVRRMLMEKGIPAERFESVMGKEATDPLNTKDPYAPENRRISITVLREQPLSLDQLKQLQAGAERPAAN
jgi:chemotaxis protein MotB